MRQFTNPILPPHAADPWMILHDGMYYYCEARDNNTSIYVRRSRNFFDIGRDEGVCVWRAPARGPYSNAVWAPELHHVDGRWLIYFAADDGRNSNHRMWVLISESGDPLGEYRLATELKTGGWAIDGTVLEHSDGNLYFVWSGWPGKHNGRQNLYIAAMKDPFTIAGERVLLATPDQPWECVEMAICEGPQILKRDGALFIVYSASGSWTSDYCLGLLMNRTGNVLNPGDWVKQGPVFQKSRAVWGIGHCSFIKSPCQTQDWIVYHSKSKRNKGWTDRDVHAQPFTWNEQSLPVFGTPVGRGVPISLAA